MQIFLQRLFFALAVLVAGGRLQAQHLWWDTTGQNDATCVYGEITVLATRWPIYYCGANWHPGEPAGGYCGIQHNSPNERRTIFSIWDTSPNLHPRVTQANSNTIFDRFTNEGSGAHTHRIWNWQPLEMFQFFLQKQPSSAPQTIDAKYYIFNRKTNRWEHSATISSPNGDEKSAQSVSTIGGGALVSFLENFGDKDHESPKLALYRLWLGNNPEHLKCLTVASGQKVFGQLNDAYFLAEGSPPNLQALFTTLKPKYGAPVFGKEGQKMEPISDKPLSTDLIKQLSNLPPAPPAPDTPQKQ